MAGDTSLSETRQVGSGRPRGGSFRVDEGVEKTSLPILKGGRMALFVCTTFSDFFGVGNDVFDEERNHCQDAVRK